MIKEIKDEINPFLFHLKYYIDDILVGTLDYTFLYDRIELEDILVNEEHRNKHVGSELMEYLVNKADELHAINITLEVNINNISAINLYKKYNFKQVAIRKNYYGNEDGILMERK